MISLVNIPCIFIRFTFYSNDNVRRKKWAEMRCTGRGGNVISCFVCLTISCKIFVLELILCSIIFLIVLRGTASLRTYPSLSFPMAIHHVNYPRLASSGLIAYSVEQRQIYPEDVGSNPTEVKRFCLCTVQYPTCNYRY